ncbi:MAG: HAD family hydrolase [Myxococcota bacterium]|nr:HAD family hydrolase [Myxococcota bacterium]MDW8361317.1 HAD family hydrolase [Myxococcales bacterium]
MLAVGYGGHVRPPPLPHQVEVLRGVLERIAAASSAGGSVPIAVFDLDGTLYDTRPRTLQVLGEYADHVAVERPDVAEALRSLELSHVHHLLRETLRECGLTHADVIRDVTHFWQQRFYSDDYLAYDVPRPGAQEYVQACHDAGASIIYLAERDVAGMLLGTVASLRDHGFPLAMPGVQLVLKPDATLGDETFKRAVLPTLSRGGEVVGYFDDDVASCNLARATFVRAAVGVVDAQTVPGAPEADPGIERVADFRLV